MRSKVSDLLDKINRAANQPSFPQLSRIEFDLLMEHLRNLYEELDLLRNEKVEIAKQLEATISIQPEPVVLKEVKKEEVLTTEKSEEAVVVKSETKVSSPKSSINEIVQSPQSLNSKLKILSKEIRHKLSSKPLRELLDLNKRFVITNTLFNGNSDAFLKAIEQIDSAKDYESAENLIRSEFLEVHQWNESSETVQLFIKLVKQRFGAE